MATYITHGSEFRRGDAASPEQFTKVAQVQNISGVGSTRQPIETTTHDSTSREFDASIKDSGQITAAIVYDPDDSTHSGLKTDYDDNTLRNFQIALTDSPAQTWTFAGKIIGFELGDMNADNVQMTNVTVQVTDDYTVA